jgi:glutamate-1-semialdehyde aminotransferase
MKFECSIEEFSKAQGFIPEGIKGMHKINEIGEYPAYFVKGKGANIWDIDGNMYIDYVMGKGPYILGYGDPQVDGAVIEQIRNGNIFPMGSTLHTLLAEKLVEVIPSAERVLFYKTGTCATSAAVRLARAYTGKNIIFSSGYHGWQDWSNDGDGIPHSEHFFDFEYSLEKLEDLLKKHAHDGAAVIVTPEASYFSIGYYKELESICKRYELVFILDEVKSGFRVDIGGFQKKYDLKPDLSTFSKAMSNGYSLSAVVGKAEVMNVNAKLHTAGTYDTEVFPFSAALATIDILQKKDVLNQIEQNGQYLADNLAKTFAQSEIGIHPVFAGGSLRLWCRDFEMEKQFYTEMAKRGVLFYAFDNSYVSAAHTREQLDETVGIASEVAETALKQYRGNYKPFKFDDIKQIKNKKGFLSNYTGQSGRGLGL